MHEVIQVIANNNFTVYVYFSDGIIKLYDCKHLLNKGIFIQISSVDAFLSKCTVMNNTLAWDLSGVYDPSNCIDIDPEQIYKQAVTVDDPLTNSA